MSQWQGTQRSLCVSRAALGTTTYVVWSAGVAGPEGSLGRRARPAPAGFAGAFRGQRSSVTLPARQQRVLDGIEIGLEGGDAKLRSMFAIFTRLTRGDGVPRTERLRARARYGLGTGPDSRRGGPLQAIMVAPIVVALLLGLATLCVVLAVSSSAARVCKSAPEPREASHSVGCESLPPISK